MSILTSDAWNIATAVLTAVGGGGILVLGLSSWLGKVWADRILEADKAKYQKEFAELKSKLDKQLHAYSVAATRIDAQRADSIRELYGALIAWHEAVIQVVAPTIRLNTLPLAEAMRQYTKRASMLFSKSEQLEKVAMLTAIYFSEETYKIIATCGISASMMSIDFMDAVRNNPTPGTSQHLDAIEAAKQTLSNKYQSDYEPARRTVITTFRQIVNPSSDG